MARVSTWFGLNLVALIGLIAAHFVLGLSSIKWWPDTFAIATNLLAGGLVSFLFYFLVVHIPEQRKKSLIKANLLKTYLGIKKDILWSVVHASRKGGRKDLTPSFDAIDRLMTPQEFKRTFENGTQGDEGFYAFENQMTDDTHEFRQIVLSLTMLSTQVEFVLNNYSLEDQESFDLFKRLELILMALRVNGPGYEESKPLCRFIWEIYAGWNWLEGDIGHDRIQKAITDI